jgi:hypothetical protein
MAAPSLADIEQLSVAERIQLAEDIWDTIAASPETGHGHARATKRVGSAPRSLPAEPTNRRAVAGSQELAYHPRAAPADERAAAPDELFGTNQRSRDPKQWQRRA